MGYEQSRGSARQRGYSPRWDKACATFKQRQPWCLGCEAVGKKVKADVVDHVEPHKGDRVKFWNTAMWQPACRWHHDVIKPMLERMFEVKEIDITDLWLNSSIAVTLSKRRPAPQSIGLDGWPT